jgi:hypothetical protein
MIKKKISSGKTASQAQFFTLMDFPVSTSPGDERPQGSSPVVTHYDATTIRRKGGLLDIDGPRTEDQTAAEAILDAFSCPW